MQIAGDSEQNPWQADLLSRRQYADFLTGYIDRKCTPDAAGLVVALDAAWGFGKSFFVTNWAAELSEAARPHLFFNAWENDAADDPTVSFMAELRKGFDSLYERLPDASAVVRVREKAQLLVTSLRKATMPALMVVGRALLKKATGVAVDDLVNAAIGKGGEAAGNIEQAAPDALEKGMDAFFERALSTHQERLRSIQAFRTALEELLAELRSGGVLNGPLYVFIDELDRCRPSYAIELLEGIKHLFSVRGVAFVVSTNLDQLSKAVGAVYGPAFDGFQYLKRFFDFEYELPEPPRAAFITAQLKDGLLLELGGASGLDIELPEDDRGVLAAFTVVADAMRLDLRAVQRVTQIAEAAATGAKSTVSLVPLWLFFLAALRHKHPADFAAVANKSLEIAAFTGMCERVLIGPDKIVCLERDERGATRARTEAPLKHVLAVLYECATKPARDLMQVVGSQDAWSTPYPSVLRLWLFQDVRRGFGTYLPLAEDAELIKAAGHIRK